MIEDGFDIDKKMGSSLFNNPAAEGCQARLRASEGCQLSVEKEANAKW